MRWVDTKTLLLNGASTRTMPRIFVPLACFISSKFDLLSAVFRDLHSVFGHIAVRPIDHRRPRIHIPARESNDRAPVRGRLCSNDSGGQVRRSH
jgi:hypothetical protein